MLEEKFGIFAQNTPWLSESLSGTPLVNDVDTSGIDPAHSEVGVADTDTRLARRYDGRCLQKEVGDVLPKVRL